MARDTGFCESAAIEIKYLILKKHYAFREVLMENHQSDVDYEV